MQALLLTKESEDASPRLQLQKVPKPNLTSPEDVLIRVKAAGVQPSDLINYKGNFAYTTFPRVIGRDFSGIVEEGPEELVGKDVFGTSGCDLSFSRDGSHAEYIVVPRQAIVLKPANLSYEQAAVIGVPYSTAMLMVNRCKIERGQTVVVSGCHGSVGTALMQILKARGINAIGMARSHADINTNDDPTLKQVTALRDGQGPDFILETTGSRQVMEACIASLGKHGTFAFISAPKNGSGTVMSMDMLRIYRLEISIIGCNSLLYSCTYAGAHLQELASLIDQGLLQGPELDRWQEVSLTEANNLYPELAKGESLKLIIKPNL